jgi:hypothetical protein
MTNYSLDFNSHEFRVLFVLKGRMSQARQETKISKMRRKEGRKERTNNKTSTVNNSIYIYCITMALKAFHDNPCIGGFGGESAVAFTSNKDDLPVENPLCQIVKELVDNAVDACTSSSVPTQLGRVKVEIYPYEQDDSILRVKISDTGEGMKNIQVCVDAFQSTKVSSSHDTASRQQLQTAGRYGIGLTLCMLHAQRLVSNSYSCITSATKDQPTYTRAFYVVDSNKDSVVCIKTEALEKPSQGESGTCVSLLVPVSLLLQYWLTSNSITSVFASILHACHTH